MMSRSLNIGLCVVYVTGFVANGVREGFPSWELVLMCVAFGGCLTVAVLSDKLAR